MRHQQLSAIGRGNSFVDFVPTGLGWAVFVLVLAALSQRDASLISEVLLCALVFRRTVDCPPPFSVVSNVSARWFAARPARARARGRAQAGPGCRNTRADATPLTTRSLKEPRNGHSRLLAAISITRYTGVPQKNVAACYAACTPIRFPPRGLYQPWHMLLARLAVVAKCRRPRVTHRRPARGAKQPRTRSPIQGVQLGDVRLVDSGTSPSLHVTGCCCACVWCPGR
jgi:hypothetical protein